jgi:hypothetical protein
MASGRLLENDIGVRPRGLCGDMKMTLPAMAQNVSRIYEQMKELWVFGINLFKAVPKRKPI